MRRRDILASGAAIGSTTVAGCLDSISSSGDSGEYPSENLRGVIPYGAGGGTDTFVRRVGSIMADEMEVDIEFSNLTAGGGIEAIREVHGSDPDGHIIFGHVSPSLPASILEQDPEGIEFEDFLGSNAVLGQFSKNVRLVCTNPDDDVADYDDLVNRYQEGEYTDLGGSAIWSSSWMTGIAMKEEHGFEWDSWIPYSETGPALQEVASGQLDATLASPVSTVGPYEEELVDVVGYIGSSGHPLITDVPFVTDQGYANIDHFAEALRWMGTAPGTPDDIFEELQTTFKNVIEGDELQSWAEETDNFVSYGSPEKMENHMSNALESIQTIREEVDT